MVTVGFPAQNGFLPTEFHSEFHSFSAWDHPGRNGFQTFPQEKLDVSGGGQLLAIKPIGAKFREDPSIIGEIGIQLDLCLVLLLQVGGLGVELIENGLKGGIVGTFVRGGHDMVALFHSTNGCEKSSRKFDREGIPVGSLDVAPLHDLAHGTQARVTECRTVHLARDAHELDPVLETVDVGAEAAATLEIVDQAMLGSRGLLEIDLLEGLRNILGEWRDQVKVLAELGQDSCLFHVLGRDVHQAFEPGLCRGVFAPRVQ
mmetsp:Transcript_11001/g.31885  ORF Transcript_11001/g.31885 Transcript_11001/m.31885 type:complete len:259 (-) Transcript_11001:164-940(-)